MLSVVANGKFSLFFMAEYYIYIYLYLYAHIFTYIYL